MIEIFRKVLVPTDFSSGYEGAVVKFERTNSLPVREVLLLHVVDEGEIELLEDSMEFEQRDKKSIEEELIRLAEQRLEGEKERIRKAFDTDNVRVLVRVGILWEEIVKITEEEEVSVIFLPTHGKLGFSGELLGSTTMRVIKKTTRPVLLLKSGGN